MTPLLAKCARGGKTRTLAEHTFDVADAFVALFGTPEKATLLAERWAAFFKLETTHGFLRHGLAAVLVHDWGKANSGFQAMLGRKGRQLVRHEHLTAMLLHLPAVREWLSGAEGLDQDVVVAAALTHHLQASHKTTGQALSELSVPLYVYWEDPDFQRMLKTIAERLGPNLSVPTGVPTLWSFEVQPGDFDMGQHLSGLKERLRKLDHELADDPQRRRLLWAVRSALIAADAAGSGLVRESHPIASWIAEAFNPAQRLNGDHIRAAVIQPRVDDLSQRGFWQDWNKFQLACDKLPDRALLLAPCGSGKTLAAWRWIAARLDHRKVGRVIFLYPTRGTATEGFRDYVSWAPEADAALVHGTSQYELEGLFDDLDAADPRSGRSYESEARLFALRQWPKRIFSATADQFLAFMQYTYASVCLLPLLADAVLVIDEVHSFDRGMFKALQDFLVNFDVPVLCMTATLPAERRKKLEECGLTVYPSRMPDDLQRSAGYPRYSVSLTSDTEAQQAVADALRRRQRVLWVVNKVDRAQALTRAFAVDPEAGRLAVAMDGLDVPLFCYHSRFKLEDRKRRHHAVVNSFKRLANASSGAALAITTQVCEMSLDLDADLLVTEVAPATSLVQRMGRCCREPLPNDGRIGRVLVYQPADEKPYKPEQLVGVRAFVEHLTAKDRVSQMDLEAVLATTPQPAAVPAPECRFIGSGPWAVAGEESFRDIEEWTRAAVLPEDVPVYEHLHRSRRETWKADGLVLPVPAYFTRRGDPRLPSWLAVADGGRYLPNLGYLREARQQPATM